MFQSCSLRVAAVVAVAVVVMAVVLPPPQMVESLLPGLESLQRRRKNPSPSPRKKLEIWASRCSTSSLALLVSWLKL